jgi:hypothetical protein
MSNRSRWFRLVWIAPALVVGLLIVVVAAIGIRSLPAVQDFLVTYPGSTPLPADAPVGIPAWLGWQHFLNMFFLLFIVRTGWVIRQGVRPSVFWMRRNDGRLRTKNPPIRIGLPLWFHLSVDALWVLNGIVFVVLLFSTGQWMRIVPTSWGVIPNAVSAGLQYLSLNWPTEHAWVNYNSLQLLSYFATVFLAAPLALITGIRIAPGFAARLRPLDRVFPTRAARTIHFLVMIYFVAFVVVHVTLVLATGALENLGVMYAASDDAGWAGFWIFAASLVVLAAGWIAARPAVLTAIAGRTGTVRVMGASAPRPKP